MCPFGFQNSFSVLDFLKWNLYQHVTVLVQKQRKSEQSKSNSEIRRGHVFLNRLYMGLFIFINLHLQMKLQMPKLKERTLLDEPLEGLTHHSDAQAESQFIVGR